MAEMETFDTAINPLEMKEVAMLLADSAEEMVKIEYKLYQGVMSDERASTLLKVARNKVKSLRVEMFAMMDMLEEMSKNEDFMADADAEDIANEVQCRTDIFSENEI